LANHFVDVAHALFCSALPRALVYAAMLQELAAPAQLITLLVTNLFRCLDVRYVHEYREGQKQQQLTAGSAPADGLPLAADVIADTGAPSKSHLPYLSKQPACLVHLNSAVVTGSCHYLP
jgi:hypothetical protein